MTDLYYLWLDYRDGEMVLSKTKPEVSGVCFLWEHEWKEPTAKIGFIHIHYKMINGEWLIQTYPVFLYYSDDPVADIQFIIDQMEEKPCDGLTYRLYNMKNEEIDYIDWESWLPSDISSSEEAIKIPGYEIRDLRVVD